MAELEEAVEVMSAAMAPEHPRDYIDDARQGLQAAIDSGHVLVLSEEELEALHDSAWRNEQAVFRWHQDFPVEAWRSGLAKLSSALTRKQEAS